MSAERKPPRRIRGTVKSAKMEKTITVSVERTVKHRRYGKYITRATTMMAHDAHDDAREGDLVEIEQTRPLSKNKCWRLVRILRRAPSGVVDTPAVDEEPAAQVS